ncbi:unnamed protein product, partial [Amoebophrya sp. A25]
PHVPEATGERVNTQDEPQKEVDDERDEAGSSSHSGDETHASSAHVDEEADGTPPEHEAKRTGAPAEEEVKLDEASATEEVLGSSAATSPTAPDPDDASDDVSSSAAPPPAPADLDSASLDDEGETTLSDDVRNPTPLGLIQDERAIELLVQRANFGFQELNQVINHKLNNPDVQLTAEDLPEVFASLTTTLTKVQRLLEELQQRIGILGDNANTLLQNGTGVSKSAITPEFLYSFLGYLSQSHAEAPLNEKERRSRNKTALLSYTNEFL